MADVRSPTRSRLRTIRALPADLAAAVAVTLLANAAVFAPVVRETPLRVPVGVAFVLFVPGYVFIAALFPERGPGRTEGDLEDPDPEREPSTADRGSRADGDRLDPRVWNAPWPARIDGIERVAYAVGTSLVIAPLVAVSLELTPWGIRPAPFVVALSAVTAVTTVVATVRRLAVPEPDRFRVPYRAWLARGRAAIRGPDSHADVALNGLLIAAVLLAAGSVGYAATELPQDDDYSAIYLLSEDEFEADSYPTDLEPGDSAALTVGIENREGQSVNYTVIAAEQEIASDETDTMIADQRELDRRDVRVDAGETAEIDYDLEPTMTGEDVRVVWLLYPGDPPDEPSVSNADGHVHLALSDGSDAGNATESVAG
ncbi:DUF1616 domain-containing protein [Natrinema versiforme]|uniref:DUF1616 domain-containing protein n=1 Tax=Natrinema versiforme TaxID=88724 RepID=A0A4P8WJ62_9EURY|nr:DUF1616 domain-containing protein [Natrinema versiforme]QCS41941.1 DUF1616 domain-containing protein [Natrinema versiforme]